MTKKPTTTTILLSFLLVKVTIWPDTVTRFKTVDYLPTFRSTYLIKNYLVEPVEKYGNTIRQIQKQILSLFNIVFTGVLSNH